MATVVATAATLVVGVAPAYAWAPKTLVVRSEAKVGSVTTWAEIYRGQNVNSYYGKVTCLNTNPGAKVRAGSSLRTSATISGSIQSRNQNLSVVANIRPGTFFFTSGAAEYSPGFYAWNDTLAVWGVCGYYYYDASGNRRDGLVEAGRKSVWVGVG